MADYESEKDDTTEPTTGDEEYDFVNYQSIPESSSNCELTDGTAMSDDDSGADDDENCPKCKPNPHAPVIDWTKRTDAEPFLNARKCMYSITLRTQYEGTGGGGAVLQERLDEYVEEGVVKLLAHYNKALDSNTVTAMLSVAGATDHFIPPRARLKMKVLIEIPADDFDSMPSAQEVTDDSTAPEEDPEAPSATASFKASLDIEGLEEKFNQVHHGLEAYARFQAIYLKTQNGTVRFPGGQMVNLLQESKHFKKLYPGLSKFLRDKGFVMRESRGNNTLGKIPGSPKLANKLDFEFDGDYKLTKVTVYRHGTCEETPVVFTGMKLYTLQNTYPFDRPTTVAFMANIDDMIDDLRRREGMMPWTEFVETYIWPKPKVEEGVDLASTIAAFASAATGHATDKDMEVLANTAVAMSNTDKMAAQTPGSWDGAQDAYQDYKNRSSADDYKGSEFDQKMGRDENYDQMIDRKTLDSEELANAACYGDVDQWMNDFADGFMDELFSIWDAISYQFQNYLCMSPEERAQLLADLQEMQNQAMAAAFAEMIALMFGFMEMINSFMESVDEIKDMKMLYPMALDEIKLCGLFNLLLAFIECLAMGLDLEEMLQPIIAAALKNMDVKSFEKLFVGLPPEAQSAVMQKVQADLGSHMMPWDAYDVQGKPDPAGAGPYGNKPSAGTVVSWGGPGTPLNAEKSASRQDPSNIPAKYMSTVRKLESTATQLREESIYYTDPDENGNTEKKYGLTEESAFSLAVNELQSSITGDLESFTDEYQLGIAASGASNLISIAQQLVDFANGSSSVSIAGEDVTVLGLDTGMDVPEAGTVEADQTVAYQTAYEQAIDDYCRELWASDHDDDSSYKDYKATCREDEGVIAIAKAAGEAANAGAGDDGMIGSNGPYGTRGSLGAAMGSAVSTLISAYAQALLDYYVVQGLEDLMKELEKLPGAKLVAKVIAAIDCIVPPLFDPPLFDFLNTLEIDFCNNQYGIVLPRLTAIQIPNWKDFFKYLLEYAKAILLYILFRLLLYILTKIVLMLFDSLCKALQKLGEVASNALADAACNALSQAGGLGEDIADEMAKDDEVHNVNTGFTESVDGSSMCETPPRSLKDLIGGAFCGKNASDAQVDATTNELMRAMGGVTEADAARMSDPDAVNQLVADISSVLTGDELSDLLLGNPNPGAIQMIQEVVQTENPDFGPAFGSPGQIRDLMKNMGNMMPPQFRKQLRDDLSVPKGERPANPNLCTTPNDIARFRDLRNAILQNKDGTTLDQANQQFDALRGRALNDLAEAADLLQGGVGNFIANNLPPIVGEPEPLEPSCSPSGGGGVAVPPDALIPRDPEELAEVMGNLNETMYDIVGNAFELDLVGRKGMIDMILSDTCGVPYSRHDKKSDRSILYSDYSGQIVDDLGLDSEDVAEGTIWNSITKQEKGAYPSYVAQYLRDYLLDGRHLGDEGYVSTSEYTPAEYMIYDDSAAGASLPAGVYPVDSKGNPVGTEDNPIVIEGEKEPDLVLEFRDNNKGVEIEYLSDTYQFAEGFNIEYSSYVIDEDEEGNQTVNTDNVYRLKVTEISNELATLPRRPKQMTVTDPPAFLGSVELAAEDEVIDIEIFGSLSEEAEDLRDGYALTQNSSVSPQTNVWSQYLLEKLASIGLTDEQQAKFNSETLFSSDAATDIYDNIANTLIAYMGRNIAENEPAYLFGYTAGEDDDLNASDKAYMSPDGDKLFAEWVAEDLAPSLGDKYLRSNGKPKWRRLKKYLKENQIMGTSNHSRLEFLSPAEFGGSWMAPPYYVTPPVSEGWMGIRDALLPEVDGKEPKRTSVCNFEDIKERVDDLTKNMPDDPRLSECPDCVVELPYSRILDRTAAAGMEGPILGLIRIYVVEEMLKAMPVFSNFKAAIPEVMDHTYVEYILAKMKIDFTENLGRKRGFLKGDALWYTFLEQCVQSYGRRIQVDGLEAPDDVKEAFAQLNSIQQDFHYPTEEELVSAKMADGHNPWEKYGVSVEGLEPEIVFSRKVKSNTKLEWYRRWHLLQAVRDSEEYANVVARAIVEEQLEYMAERFSESLEAINLKPEITDIHKYFIGSGDFVAGNQGFWPDLERYTGDGKIMDVAEDINSNPFDTYKKEDWEPLPVDVQVINSGTDDALTGEAATTSIDEDSYGSRLTSGEFILEKYIRVEDKSELGVTDNLPEVILQRSSALRGVVNIDKWKQFLNSGQMVEHQDKKLSDIFGDLEFIFATDDDGNEVGEPTGIEGSLGIKYGLRLSYVPPEAMAEELDAVTEQLKADENWASIQDMAEKEKAYFLEAPIFTIHNDSMLAGKITVVNEAGDYMVAGTYGAATGELIEKIEAGEAQERTEGSDNGFFDPGEAGGAHTFVYYDGYRPQNAKYVIPLMSAEYDALDHSIANHIEAIDEEMDLTCLAEELLKNPEFELLFRYVFPLNRIVSIMSIFTGRAFLPSIGEKTMTPDQEKYNKYIKDGYPTPDASLGEWQIFNVRLQVGRNGASFDRWDDEFLFRRTKRRLVRMFRSYFKSRQMLSGGDDEGDGPKIESDFKLPEKKKKRKKKRKKDKGMKRTFRKQQRRERDRPYDKNGN